MTVEKWDRLPYLKRQPTGHKSGSFCDGTVVFSDEEKAAYRFFKNTQSIPVTELKINNQQTLTIQNTK